MPKKDDIEQAGITRAIDLRDIDPSPFQHRKIFDADKLKELAASEQRDGLTPCCINNMTKGYLKQ